MNEREIEKQILSYLKMKGILSWKCKTVGTFDPVRKVFRSPSPWYRKGVSDILGIYQGKFLAIEVKSKKGRASIDQLQFISDINSNGGIAFVAKSVEDVAIKLKCTEDL